MHISGQPHGAFPARFLRITLVVTLLALLGLMLVGAAYAQSRSGGGFGGSSRGSSGSSRSSGGGSFGGSSNSSRGGGYSGGGYSGPVIINNGGYGGGYYGGGGYSSGGGFALVPILLILGVGVVIFLVMRRSAASAGGGSGLMSSFTGNAQAVMVQVIMLEGDEVKKALQQVAENGDPDSDAGLAQMLQEAALVVLRHPERWVYGDVQRAQGEASRMDGQLGSWATQARAAFTEQTTSNYQNRDPKSGFTHKVSTSKFEAGGLYLAVTLGAAAHALAALPPAGTTDAKEVQAALQAVAGVTAGDLIRAEVVWSPDEEGEFLSEDEAIMKYPQAKKL
jgi:uncharacterized membrane protein